MAKRSEETSSARDRECGERQPLQAPAKGAPAPDCGYPPVEELLLNLTHCSECGLPFEKPVTAAEALESFPSLDVASFACSSCSSQWEADSDA